MWDAEPFGWMVVALGSGFGVVGGGVEGFRAKVDSGCSAAIRGGVAGLWDRFEGKITDSAAED